MKLFKKFSTIIFFLVLGFIVTVIKAQNLEHEKSLLATTISESEERCGTDQFMKEYLSNPTNVA